MSAPTTRIGSGAGFAGDRIQPAVDLVRGAELDDLVLECLAERTIALGQQRRRRDPSSGHDPRARRWFEALLPETLVRGTRVVSNLGAANPRRAGEIAAEVARARGLRCRVGVVTGDDVLDRLDLDQPALETGRPLREHGEVVSANAYLGADALLPALEGGADVVVAGRVADPSLFVAPLADRLGWDLGDVDDVAVGTLVGHLLECGAQVTGGYFADPGRKDVPDLAHLGYPYADVSGGGAVLQKLPGTGGLIDRRTVREQLLYEVGDPRGYVTPDVVLDLVGVELREEGADRVRVEGAAGRRRPDRLKVSVGYRAGFRAEAGISYAGPGCVARARLAGEVVRARQHDLGREVQVEVLGSVPDQEDAGVSSMRDCRLRVAAQAQTLEEADDVCAEVEALYTNGPAGGGGVRTRVTDVVGIVSALVDRDTVRPAVDFLECR